MQSPSWYARRLRAMSVSEVLRRGVHALRNQADRIRLAKGAPRRLVAKLVDPNGTSTDAGWPCGFPPPGAWRGASEGESLTTWLERLHAQAERAKSHRFTIFDLEDHDLGDPIDWNHDPKSGTHAPMSFGPSINYRDVRVTGDCKFVWEPNRHHHLVVLGRAYRATGDIRYARAVADQLRHWLDQCPFPLGMNWRSPLELGVRLINWVWALDLIRDAGAIDAPLRARILESVALHVWEISRKYSHNSSANNHLIGEAAGIWIAACYFGSLRKAAWYRRQSSAILCEQILRQTHSDGGGREQALGYHMFVLQFFLLAGLVARRVGADWPRSFWDRLERMFEFLAALAGGGRDLPMFGDCDDGYVLDLGGGPRQERAWLCVGAILFQRTDWKPAAGDYSEAAYWLLGPESRGEYERLAGEDRPRLESRAFRATGLYLLQSGHHGAPDRISVVFDCAPLGYGPLAAHGHADALSFTLRAFGVDVFVDPGTYDYFSYPQWRNYFRSTRAHNSVEIDGADQSEMLGPFLWGARAQATCLAWEPGPGGGRVVGEHDGYRRLPDPVIHRRTLELDGNERRLTVRDEIHASKRHEIVVYFHLSETCRIREVKENRFQIDAGPGPLTLIGDPRLQFEVLTGGAAPGAGWVSRGYHRKARSTTLVGRCRADGTIFLENEVRIGVSYKSEEARAFGKVSSEAPC